MSIGASARRPPLKRTPAADFVREHGVMAGDVLACTGPEWSGERTVRRADAFELVLSWQRPLPKCGWETAAVKSVPQGTYVLRRADSPASQPGAAPLARPATEDGRRASGAGGT